MLGTIVLCSTSVAAEPSVVINAPMGADLNTADGSTVPTASAPEMSPEDFKNDLQSIEDKILDGKSTISDRKLLSKLLDKQAMSCTHNASQILDIIDSISNGETLSDADQKKILNVIDHIQAHNSYGHNNTTESFDAEVIMKLVQDRLREIITKGGGFTKALEGFRVFLIAQLHGINEIVKATGDTDQLRNLRTTLYDILSNNLRHIVNIRKSHIMRIQVKFFRFVLLRRRQRLDNRRKLRTFINNFIGLFAKKIAQSRNNARLDLSLIVEISKFIDICIQNRFFDRAIRLRELLQKLFGYINVNSFVGLKQEGYYNTLIGHFNGARYGSLASLLLSHNHNIITTITTKLLGGIDALAIDINSFNSAILNEITGIITSLETELTAAEQEFKNIERQLADEDEKAKWLTFVRDNFAESAQYHNGLVNWFYEMSKFLAIKTGLRTTDPAYLYAMAQYTGTHQPNKIFNFKSPHDPQHRITIFLKGSCNKTLEENARNFMLGKCTLKFSNDGDKNTLFDKVFQKFKESYGKTFAKCCTCPTP